MFNKILVALDTKESNDFLFQKALALAKAITSDLIVLGVSTLDANGTLPILSPPESSQRQYEGFKAKELGILRRYQDQAIAAGIRTKLHQELGDHPGKTICEIAKAGNTDLVIVGSHGYRGIGEVLMGSVSNYVMHRAPCSVLIVRNPGTTPSDGNEELGLSQSVS